jgi:hypothetical protein
MQNPFDEYDDEGNKDNKNYSKTCFAHFVQEKHNL